MSVSREFGKGRAAAAAAGALCVLAAPATAAVLNGTTGPNRVNGTPGADKIFLGAGADRASGRGGADKIVGAQGGDRLSGGRGRDELLGGPGRDRLTGGPGNDRLLSGSSADVSRGGAGRDVFGGGSGADLLAGQSGPDRIFGGKGRDRILGGAGNDRLNSADGVRDRRVAGGPGRNRCRIDRADLRVLSGCDRVVIVPDGTFGGGGIDGRGDGGTRRGTGAEGPLVLTSGSGLTCSSTLPTCLFQLVGRGADQTAGLVRGEGGVQLAAGGTVSFKGDAWSAQGAYGCTRDGFIVVSIGSETVRAPVTCRL